MKRNPDWRIPATFEVVNLGRPISEVKARQSVINYSGHIALVKTTHLDDQYYSGKIFPIQSESGGYDQNNFSFVRMDSKGKKVERKVRYDDLEALMIGSLSNLE